MGYSVSLRAYIYDYDIAVYCQGGRGSALGSELMFTQLNLVVTVPVSGLTEPKGRQS